MGEREIRGNHFRENTARYFHLRSASLVLFFKFPPLFSPHPLSFFQILRRRTEGSRTFSLPILVPVKSSVKNKFGKSVMSMVLDLVI